MKGLARIINTTLLMTLSSSYLLFLCIPCLSEGITMHRVTLYLCSTHFCYAETICLCIIICLISPLLDYKLHDDRYYACLLHPQLFFE